MLLCHPRCRPWHDFTDMLLVTDAFYRSTKQVPNYLESQDALRGVGVDAVVVYCVNDAAVMLAWAKNQKVRMEL